MADNVPMSQAATTSLVTTLQNTDLFALAREDNTSETGYRSKVSRVDALAKKVVNETDYSQLQTTDKKIIGAINEVNTKASQFDNMTATASGSIATFDNGGDDIPVSEFECEIVAQQSSGTPSPSDPLPITGFSQADITVSGVNLWNEDWEQGLYNNQGVKVENTNAIRAKNPIPVKPNTEYMIVGLSGNRVCYYDVTGTFISTKTNVTTDTVPSNACFMTFSTSTSYGGSYNNDISINYPSTDTQYHAYTGNLYTVSFGQTIYGGRLIYNGQWSIEATQKYYSYTEVLYYGTYGSDNANLYYMEIPNYTTEKIKNISNSTYEGALFSNMLSKISTVSVSDLKNNEIRTQGNSAPRYFYFRADSFASLADLNAVLANTPLQVVAELETPVIIPITSSTRVKTISGDNNIYSSTGDCELKYFTNKADSLAELIKVFVV